MHVTETIGKYELHELVATGGMAEIWTASVRGPAGFQREIAIKRILPHLARDEHFTSMFLDEASIASKLAHPNIAQIYELGEDGDEYFIAMEYVDGMDLASILDEVEARNTFIPVPIAAKITADVLNALHFAHDFEDDGRAYGIVHRDVSPHNVLISKSGVVKLVDFGVAKAVDRHSKTQTGVVKGKLSYMAPEQVEQSEIDRRADIFSAGVVLFELLTNQSPFGRELKAISAILNDDPPDPREMRHAVPWELVQIIRMSLAKEPGDRFQTALEMASAIEAWLHSATHRVGSTEISSYLSWLSTPAETTETKSSEPGEATLDRELAEADTLADESAQADIEQAEVNRPESRRVPTETAVAGPESEALGTLVAILVVVLAVAAFSFKDTFLDSNDAAPQVQNTAGVSDAVEQTEEDEPVEYYFEEDEAEEFVEETFVIDEDDAIAWTILGEYEAADQLVENWVARVESPPEDPILYDPGHPEIISLLGLPAFTESEASPPKKNRRVTRRVKTKKKPEARTSKKSKKPPKKRSQDLQAIDRALPNF